MIDVFLQGHEFGNEPWKPKARKNIDLSPWFVLKEGEEAKAKAAQIAPPWHGGAALYILTTTYSRPVTG